MKKGFTIIETALFIGLSGLLLIALTANHTRGIAIQRYEDSVDSLANFLKDVYSSVLNPENAGDAIDTNNREKCTAKNGSIKTNHDYEDAKTLVHGSSSCAIYGKVIYFGDSSGPDNDEDTIYVFDVIGDIDDHKHPVNYTTVLPLSNSMTLLTKLTDVHADYRATENNVCVPAGAMEKYTPEWGTRLVFNDERYKGIILIARSPDTGEVFTYVRDNGNEGNIGETSDITLFSGNLNRATCATTGEVSFDLVKKEPTTTNIVENMAQENISFCLKSEDFFTSDYSQSITILKNGQNPSAVLTNKGENSKNDCTKVSGP